MENIACRKWPIFTWIYESVIPPTRKVSWKRVCWTNLTGENGPLWRVTLLPNARYEPDVDEDIAHITSYPHQCICIFGFHHITVDGPSYSRMFAEFMRYLDNIINNEEPEVSSMPMLPPVDLY